MLLQTIKYNMI